jgi:hypothetical protein
MTTMTGTSGLVIADGERGKLAETRNIPVGGERIMVRGVLENHSRGRSFRLSGGLFNAATGTDTFTISP